MTETKLVTKVEEMDQKRCRVYLDDKFAFVLYRGEIRKYQIQEGIALSDTVYKEIMEEVLSKRAKLRCMNLLKGRCYTEKQLRDKLCRGEYSEELIEEAIAYVKSYGYVNDRRYAEEYILYHMDSRTEKRIEQDLYAKGIPQTLTREIFQELRSDGMKADEIEMGKKILKKKNFDPKTAENKEKQRISAYLYRKGFRPEIISQLLLLDIMED